MRALTWKYTDMHKCKHRDGYVSLHLQVAVLSFCLVLLYIEAKLHLEETDTVKPQRVKLHEKALIKNAKWVSTQIPAKTPPHEISMD